ncbi:unnamed protein product [Dimorphilus gyrociliatus]|uniref:Methylated-DNA--protein-cysteine methyltransferase n=1 Tax=Dimorphilus gyrociliatus TaxID=2664684 RepID=A0A7I8VSB5_9ANNE|nr:unnamed protein product [Dimorphilus gyrociliatus]
MQKCKYGPTNTYMINTPLGEFQLECCSYGIHSLHHMPKVFKVEKTASVVVSDQRYPDNGYQYKPVKDCVNWLQEFFDNKEPSSLPTICWSEEKTTDFHLNIWKTLAERVKFGQTVSYGQLAEMSGYNKRFSRAVGHSMRENPVVLIVPCHRVILASKKPGHYAAGQKDEMKQWLLNHERERKVQEP